MLRAGRAFVWYSRQGLRVVACMLLIAIPGQTGRQMLYWLLIRLGLDAGSHCSQC
jgi:hypothetical protein